MQELNQQLEQNLEKKSAQLEQASRALADRATKYPYERIIGRSPQMREVLLLVDKVVDTDVPVLVHGESGTGKELIAQAIHEYGRRKKGPFVTVNCGAIAESLMESEFFGHVKGAFTGAVETKQGLFQAAHRGTIFLDEIGEMSFDMQKKLLRVLQEREVRPVGGKDVSSVDVRVIAATNKDLRKMMQAGSFRDDLYYRIAVISLELPPLRDRQGDIPMLVEHFAAQAAATLGLTNKPFDDAAVEAMTTYAWPGNVRELDNEVKKALTLSDDRVTVDDLSVAIQGERAGPEPSLIRAEEGATLKESLEKMERALIEQALERTGGNQTRAAKELGISRVWLRKKMERHGLFR
jgi:transcriptional regulator with PAS, ATPase and Fis domain